MKNLFELLQMHSSMEVNDQRLENIQIGFWNPKKCAMDQDQVLIAMIFYKSENNEKTFSARKV